MRSALREMVFRFELAMKINVTVHDLLDRELLLEAVFAWLRSRCARPVHPRETTPARRERPYSPAALAGLDPGVSAIGGLALRLGFRGKPVGVTPMTRRRHSCHCSDLPIPTSRRPGHNSTG